MSEEKEVYEFVRANIAAGELVWDYKINTSETHGSEGYDDEDVSDWTDEEIKDLTCSMLSVDAEQRDIIEVIWN